MRAPGIIRFLLLCALSLGIAAGAEQLLGTAFAANRDGRGVQAFSLAVKAYEDSDWNAAAKHVEDALQAGLSKELTARAIHLRAHVNERSGALARALQDYSTALWMGTLPKSERKVAKEGKQRVIAAMGLNSPASGGARASAAPKPARQSPSGGGWGLFDVFGSSKPASPPPPAAPRPARSAAAPHTAKPAKSRAQTSASAVFRRRKPAVTRSARTEPAARAARTASPRPPASSVRMASLQPAAAQDSSYGDEDGHMIRFGSARSESAGQSMARKIKASLSDILVGRDLDVQASGAGGYEIVAGPYKRKNAAIAVCSAIKRRGVRCVVSP